MTRQAHNELLELQHTLEQLQQVQDGTKDESTFIWGNQRFSSSKYYQNHFANVAPHPAVIWIWKSKCIPKIKFFAWLVLNDRLNTRNMLRRRCKFLVEGYNCALCQDGVEETIEHLFFSLFYLKLQMACLVYYLD